MKVASVRALNDMTTADFIVETRFTHSEVDMGERQVVMQMVMERVAKDVADEILKRYKKTSSAWFSETQNFFVLSPSRP